jgi:hypothetical protein
MPGLKPRYIEKIDERGDLQVWIVDGAYIRTHMDEEFTNFGQHYRVPYVTELDEIHMNTTGLHLAAR